jgi:hypothetical protein
MVLEDLEWYAKALARAREEGELMPGVFRAHAAQMAANAPSEEG